MGHFAFAQSSQEAANPRLARQCHGRLGLLGNTDTLNAPLSATSYTSQMVQDQQAVTIADIVKNDSSVRLSGHSGDQLDSFFIRGFPVGDQNSGEIAFDGVYGIAPNYRVLADYAERIELVKGPAALLFGISPASSVGGTINIVPKRATSDPLTRISADVGPSAQGGGQIDLSRRFGPERQWGVRINGSHHQGDTLLDNQSRKADVGAIALDYQGERLRATLAFYAREEQGLIARVTGEIDGCTFTQDGIDALAKALVREAAVR